MKCQYTIPLRGDLQVSHAHPVEIRGWTFDLVRDGNRCTAVRVTVPYPTDHPLPEVTPPVDGAPMHIKVATPHLEEVLDQLRAAFGLVSFFEPVSLETGQVETTYIPETDAERASLKLLSIGGSAPRPSSRNTSFRLLLQCLLAGQSAREFEVALTFYRLAQLALKERRYIVAFYNYYFVIESLFGNGRTGKKELLTAFMSSAVLMDSIASALADPASTFSRTKPNWASTPRAVLEHFIAKRGSLHHHSRRSTKPWHPESHTAHQSDCIHLAEVTTALLVKVASQGMYTPETKTQVESLCPHAAA